ncbi:unnamed protein product [Rotaria sordida]|uniref:Uncharacterized protein n=1 Tax=Rotaria sordida TaxID=392033 RepID=A0A818UNF3_9BILA|nr:unnamed protein product [Rotaria sordida]CAF3699565.1 unnamed protein product [Rotaria sordida]
MPEIGSCTDITCDGEIKELYECHCCSRLICLNHLIEHIEITKQNKGRLGSLRNELNTIVNTLKLIVEEKFLIIGREQNLIEQAKKILDVSSSSIDELENIFEQINQTIASNRSEITVKVEPSLSETKYCSCVCKCNKESMNSNDVVEEFKISKDDEHSMDINHDFIDTDSFDETTKSIQDEQINEEQKKYERKPYRNISDVCPLTFDGAYGLTKANHSIKLCEHRIHHRIGLYAHFICKHQLKEVYARRLIQAVANNQDPTITKLFDENENVIDHFYKVSCPFLNRRINSTRYVGQNVITVPCRCRAIPLMSLKRHLLCNHKISSRLAKRLVDGFKARRKKE